MWDRVDGVLVSERPALSVQVKDVGLVVHHKHDPCVIIVLSGQGRVEQVKVIQVSCSPDSNGVSEDVTPRTIDRTICTLLKERGL